MPRPSKKAERRKEILKAYGRCVARYGVEGATLEKTADEVGLARALIRHNVGNRDDLLRQLTQQFIDKSNRDMQELAGQLPKTKTLETLLDWLFDPDWFDQQETLIASALISAAANDDELRSQMRRWLADFVKQLENILATARPNAKREALETVSAGLTGIFFNVTDVSVLGGQEDLTRNSKAAAKALVKLL